MKDSDFARLLPKIVAHLRKQASCAASGDSGSGSAERGGSTTEPLDFLPTKLVQQYGLMPWLDALEVIHAELGQDIDLARRQAARRRLVFNETLLMSLMMLHHRADLQNMEAVHEHAQEPVVCKDLVRAHLPAACTS